MMSAIAAAVLACPNLAVPAQLMYHVAEVESGFNRFAIGVVGGRLQRQPENFEEAVATARMLESSGYNFSLGVSQVNRANLRKHGLDTYEKAFGVCDNAIAGSRILQQCYANASGQWGKAFSCYYAGNHTTGFRDGYVQKMYAALGRGNGADEVHSRGPSPVVVTQPTPAKYQLSRHVSRLTRDSAAYRVAIRSVALDGLATATGVPVIDALITPPPPDATAGATATTRPAAATRRPAAAAAATAAPAGRVPRSDATVFHPQVTGPSDAPGTAPSNNPQAPVSGSAAPATSAGDGAFVF